MLKRDYITNRGVHATEARQLDHLLDDVCSQRSDHDIVSAAIERLDRTDITILIKDLVMDSGHARCGSGTASRRARSMAPVNVRGENVWLSHGCHIELDEQAARDPMVAVPALAYELTWHLLERRVLFTSEPSSPVPLNAFERMVRRLVRCLPHVHKQHDGEPDLIGQRMVATVVMRRVRHELSSA